ncbi:hypothetical protein P3T76_014403 [Phytophthora citrophthora]|uniref:Uncharacterized protein n=1 Tax=Phytophthora citrophthora TaxID=4793 RepID=A0AAD9LBA3_9STRA|nr:hypothetical protein P3T76_014403 [Phytophthora citrophthora]
MRRSRGHARRDERRTRSGTSAATPSWSRKNYHTFVKDGCAEIYMNPWTKDACQVYADALELEDKMKWVNRFNLVGGKPRLLFSPSKTLESLVSEVKMFIRVGIDDLQALMKNEEKMKHILIEMRRDKAVGIQSDEKLLDIVLPNIRVWEQRRSERFLLQRAADSQICVRSLEGDSNEILLGPYSAKFKEIRKRSEIRTEEMVYRPMLENFSVEGVLVVPAERRVPYLQATVSLKRPVWFKWFKKVVDNLADREEFAKYTHTQGEEWKPDFGVDVMQSVGKFPTLREFWH